MGDCCSSKGIVGMIYPLGQAWSRSKAQNYLKDKSVPCTAAETDSANEDKRYGAHHTI
jgi:hypothetical protein